MAQATIKPAELEEKAASFDSIIRYIDIVAGKIHDDSYLISPYSGFGIDEIKKRLSEVENVLKRISSNLTDEKNALKKVAEHAVNADRTAYGEISGKSVEPYINNSNAKSDIKTITVTNEDWGKLLKQFKYYSTRNDATKRFYELLDKFYKLNRDIDLTEDDYRALRDTYNLLIHKDDHAAFVYSNVDPYFAEGKFKTFDGHYGLDLVNANGKAGITKLEYAYGCDGNTSVYTIEIGTLSGNAKVSIDWLNDFVSGNEAMFKKVLSGEGKDKNKKKALEFIIAEIEAKVGVSLTGITISSVQTKRISDKASIYSSSKLTVGELNAKANAGISVGSTGTTFSAGAKAGASIAKLETDAGIITNDERISGGVGLNAGEEVGAEASYTIGVKPKGETKVSAGIASVKFEIDDGFGYYNFLDI